MARSTPTTSEPAQRGPGWSQQDTAKGVYLRWITARPRPVKAAKPQRCGWCGEPVAIGHKVCPTRRGWVHANCWGPW